MELNQPIKVLAKFIEGKLTPVKFAYNNRAYIVEEVSGSYLSKNHGRLPIYFFAVQTKTSADIFELAFNFEDLSWKLKKIVSEDYA